MEYIKSLFVITCKSFKTFTHFKTTILVRKRKKEKRNRLKHYKIFIYILQSQFFCVQETSVNRMMSLFAYAAIRFSFRVTNSNKRRIRRSSAKNKEILKKSPCEQMCTSWNE